MRVYTILNQNFASLEYVNCRVLPHAPMPMQSFIQSVKG